MANIVVLDGYTLNPGDLSWAGLEALGKCVIHERTPAHLTVDRAQDAEIVFTNKVMLGRAELAQLPRLRYIGVLATGYNIVEVAAARERGVVVTNIPAYGTRSVAQLTFALLLELALHVGHHAESVRQGGWTRSPDFSYSDFPLIELEGLTLGLIGFGRIGQAMAQLGLAFGMPVLAHSHSGKPSVLPGVTMTDLESVFSQSDVVSLHCPLTDQNRGMVNAARLALMRPNAFFINTSRGGLVKEADLALALNEGRIAGAGLDVLTSEPPPPDNPLLTAKNCIITPHQAWATGSARRRLMDLAVGNLRAFLDGRPVNVVNP
jgi:glycerate dehydrogenase